MTTKPRPFAQLAFAMTLPVAYVVLSTAARIYKFGANGLSPRALIEPCVVALFLFAASELLSNCRKTRTLFVTITFPVLFAGNLVGLLLSGILGLPPSLRLIPQIPDVIFIRTTFQDGAAASSLLKTSAFFIIGSAIAVVAHLKFRAPPSPIRWVPVGISVIVGATLGVSAFWLPLDTQSRDRDAWIALLYSLPGGTEIAAPPRTDTSFERISILSDTEPTNATVPSVHAPTHVVVIIWETGISSEIGWPDRTPENMPTLRTLIDESLVCERHCSTSSQSTKSVFSVLTGLYPQPSIRNETVTRPDANWPMMGREFRAAGFKTSAMTSFPADIDRFGEFCSGGGFQSVSGTDELGLDKVSDGLIGRDDQLYARASEWIGSRGREKTLSVILPSNSHHPYWSPDTDSKASRSNRYRSAMTWQDKVLGQFIESLRSKGVWDNTALVLCADHGNYHGFVPNDDGYFFGRYHVPCLVRIPDAAARRLSRVTSHVDILPTLLDLIQRRTGSTQGVSLLRPIPARITFAIESYTKLWIYGLAQDSVLGVSPEDANEYAASWPRSASPHNVIQLRDRVAQFHSYQYWKIQDYIDGP